MNAGRVLWVDRTATAITVAVTETVGGRVVNRVYLAVNGHLWQRVTGPLTAAETAQWVMRGSEPQPVSDAMACWLDQAAAAQETAR